MTVTPSTLILNALIMTGDKRINGTLSTTEQTYYLARLIAWMASIGLEPLNNYAVTEDSLALTTGTTTYTIGSGGTWNTARPKTILEGFIRDSSSFDSPLRIIDKEAYHSLALKSTGNTYPMFLYYDKDFASSLAKVYFYPAPSASLTAYIYSPKQLQIFTAIDTTMVLPPGYQLFLESNFAILCCAGYREVPATTLKIARESKAAIQKANLPDLHMRLDAAVSGGRGTAGTNVYTGP